MTILTENGKNLVDDFNFEFGHTKITILTVAKFWMHTNYFFDHGNILDTQKLQF